jgi:hypothetical protein
MMKTHLIEWATGLIKQLPKEHEGRGIWLLNHGTCDESNKLRILNILRRTDTTPEQKVEEIHNIFKPTVTDTCEQKRPSMPPQQNPPRW